MAESNENLIGFIASTVETMSDRLNAIEQRMVTREDLARLDGRLNEGLDVAMTSIRGHIEQVHIRLDSMEDSLASRFEHVEGELSGL